MVGSFLWRGLGLDVPGEGAATGSRAVDQRLRRLGQVRRLDGMFHANYFVPIPACRIGRKGVTYGLHFGVAGQTSPLLQNSWCHR